MKGYVAVLLVACSLAGCTVFCHVPIVGTYEPECVTQRGAGTSPTPTPAP